MIAIDPNGRGSRRIRTSLLPLLAALVSTGAGAATITVDSIEDPGTSDDSSCTLREAVAAANNNADGDGCVADTSTNDYGTNDTINFSADIAAAETITDRTIQLTDGELPVTQPLTINGADRSAEDPTTASTVIVDANGTEENPGSNTSRILNIQADTILQNLSLTGGRAGDANGGIILLGDNDSAPMLTTDQTTLTDGLATASGGSGGLGGAIYIASGALEFNNSQILNSRAARGGGAIHDAAGNGVTLSGSQIRQNEAGVYEENEDEERIPDDSADPADGGGLYLTGGATITDNEDTTPTRIDNNTATGSGGGVWTAGATSVVSSVVSSNTAHGDATGAGGGNIYVDTADLTFKLATVANGEAVGDNGVGGAVLASGGSITAMASILQRNFAVDAGGGLALRDGATATITRTVFSGNGIQTPNSQDTAVTNSGGAIHANGAGAITLNTGALSSNAADVNGGGIWSQGSDVTVIGLEIRQNAARGDDSDQGGGALYHTGSGNTLAIEDSRLIGNVASGEQGSGGAIFNDGNPVTITDSDLTRNSSGRAGGAIETTGGEVTITESMLGGNASDDGNMAGTNPGNGGAVHVGGGTVTVEDSTVSYNTASRGGGLWNNDSSTLTVRNSTVSNNQATGNEDTTGDGGGLYQVPGGAATLNFVTVTRNSANNAGGGIAVGGDSPAGEINADASIIANNDAATGPNFVEDSVTTGPTGNIVADNAGLDTLQLLGGPTLTHPLLSDSQAVDASGGGECGSAPFDLDQRAATRDAQCDAGSYERTDDPVVNVSANGPDSLNTTVGEDTTVLAFTLDNSADNSVTLGGFSAEPLFNSGYSALLSLLPSGFEASQQLQFDVVVDANGNGQLDDDETTVVGSANNGQGREFNLDSGQCSGGCVLGADGSGNDTLDLLVVFRAPEGDEEDGGDGSSVATLPPQTPLYAGGMLLGLIGVFGLTGVRRRTRCLLALVVIAIGLTACSSADDTPPPNPSFTGAPELQGDIRFRLVELQGMADSSSDIVVGDGLPVYGPGIFVQ